MSSAEFSEWLAFAALQPWGQWRDDYRVANLMALLANIYRKKGQKAFEYQDFMPDFEAALDEREKQAVIPAHRRLANKIMGIFGMMANGKS